MGIDNPQIGQSSLQDNEFFPGDKLF